MQQMRNLSEEIVEAHNFTDWKRKVDEELKELTDYERLQEKEKALNQEIRFINDELKKKMDEFAKEAQESSDEISKLRKQVNECKTQSDLEI